MEKLCIKFIQDEKLQCSLQIAKDPCYKKMLEEKMKMEGYGEIPTCFLCLQLSLRQQRKLLWMKMSYDRLPTNQNMKGNGSKI